MMKLIRNVVIKQVLTKEKKASIIQRYEEELIQYKREIDQLNFHLHRATRDRGTKHEQQQLRARYNKDIKKREDNIQALSFKIQQINQLKVGTEIREGTAESIIDINEGDKWPDLDCMPEIIIKNGIIQKIREGRNEDD
ncbi:YlqD family protein [Halalkalibacter lacteus]|uniref:YlqD family protein n=1 Tax=Halalkalibacter lacteus TaxID=3090663 RepID=UPI002FCBA382